MDLNKPLQAQVYDYIKDKILRGELNADSLYSETRFAKELSISRTPLRDALRYLEQDGYIVIVPSRGFRIRKLDQEGLRVSIELRCAIEGYCVHRVAKQANTANGEKLIRNLEALLLKMKECVQDPARVSEFIDYDHAFHSEITSSVGNEEFQAVLQKIHYLVRQTSESVLKVEGRIAETFLEHQLILNNIRAGDASQAYQEMMRHLNKPLEIIEEQKYFGIGPTFTVKADEQ